MRGWVIAATLACLGLLAINHTQAAEPAPATAPLLALGAQEAGCPPAIETETQDGALIHLAPVLKPGGALDILAVGLGPVGTAVPHAGAPAHPSGIADGLARALQAAVHGLRVTVTLGGGSGKLAQSQLQIITEAMKAHHYQLVLWQTGTLEAVNDEPAGDFYQALSDGVAAITDGGADVVLLEPQYSRFLEANANLSPYLAAMQAQSATPGVVLFHRYQLMHDWVEAGLIDLENAVPPERQHVAAHLHACLGAELARALLANVAGAAE
jgi:hypothetical protein